MCVGFVIVVVLSKVTWREIFNRQRAEQCCCGVVGRRRCVYTVDFSDSRKWVKHSVLFVVVSLPASLSVCRLVSGVFFCVPIELDSIGKQFNLNAYLSMLSRLLQTDCYTQYAWDDVHCHTMRRKGRKRAVGGMEGVGTQLAVS